MCNLISVEDLYEEIDPEDINRHRERLSEPHIHNITSGAAADGDDYGIKYFYVVIVVVIDLS